MADSTLNLKMTANTTELRSGLAEAAKAAEQFSSKSKQLVTAGQQMGNGLKQIGTAASGLKGKLGGFASEMTYFADELSAGVGPVDALASRIPLLIRSIGGFNPVVKVLSGVLGGAVGGLVAMGVKALTTSEQVKTLSQVSTEVQAQMKLWEAANKSLQTSFTELGNTSNQTALQIRRGFFNETELARKALIDGFKQLPIALGAEMEKMRGMFDPVVNAMKDLSPWVSKTLIGFRTLGGGMVAVTPQAQSLLNTLQGFKSLGASQQQLDSIAIAVNNVNKAAQGKDPQVYAAALQDLANRAAEMLSVLGVAPGKIQAIVGPLYEGANAAAAMAGQVSKLTASLIELAKARNAVSSAGASLGGFIGGAEMDLAVRKYTDVSVKVKQARADVEGFWTAAKTGADAAARATLSTYVPAQDRVIAKQKELKQAYATLGVNATAEDTRNYNNALSELDAQLSKLSSGGGGGGGGGGSLGRAAKGIKAAGDAAKKAGQDMKNATDPMKEFADGLKSIAESIGSGVVDALFAAAEGTKSLKESFTEMAKSVLKQVANMIVQLLVLKPLLGMLGGGLGGGGLLGGILGRSAGGVTRSIGAAPRIAPGAPISRAATVGTYGSGAPAVAVGQPNITINNNVAGANVKTRMDDDKLIIDIIDQRVSEQLLRGGNSIDSAMSRAFGVRRVGY